MVDQNVLDSSWYVITDIYKNDPDITEYIYENLKKKKARQKESPEASWQAPRQWQDAFFLLPKAGNRVFLKDL